MDKFDMNKGKMHLSEVGRFARRYTMEVLTAVAIVVAALSAWAHFFIGTLGWSVLFLVIGSVVGIFFPNQLDKWVKKLYSLSSGGQKTGEIISEAVKIAVALFLPFLYFGFLGVLAGTAYHYYMRHAQSTHKGDKAA